MPARAITYALLSYAHVWYADLGTQFTGDGAQRDEDGYIWILGRMDDVVNVSGHRLSTAEIEAALLEHSKL